MQKSNFLKMQHLFSSNPLPSPFDEEPYGTISNLNDKKDAQNQRNLSSLFCIKFRQKNNSQKKLKLKKVKKNVSFSWRNKRNSFFDSTGPTYDYIDAENRIDSVYTKVIFYNFYLVYHAYKFQLTFF